MPMIRIEHNGITYLCETAEEARQLGQMLQRETPRPGTIIETVHASAAVSWTPDLYRRFVAHLGPPQRRALEVLIEKRIVLGEYLCEQVGVSGSQALAGVLSSLSRQAGSLGLPPRTVFAIDNIRRPEGRQSLYTVDENLVRATQESLEDGKSG